jgi:hypothetical protein
MQSIRFAASIEIVAMLIHSTVVSIDLSPVINTKDTVGFPYTLTDGRSIHEVQEIYRRTDHYDPQGA